MKSFFRTTLSSPRRAALALPAAALLVLAGLAVPALAQPDGQAGERPAWGRHAGPGGHGGHGGPGAHRLGRLARVLELTEAQVAEARALHEAARADLEPIFAASRELRTRLDGLLDAPSPDPAQVGEVVIALRQNREAMRAVREETKAGFEALLTAEQREKLATLEDAKEEWGRRGKGRRGPRGRRSGGPAGGSAGGPLGGPVS